MAVVNVLSAQLTNRDALPIVPQDSRLAGSAIRGASAVLTLTNGDNIGSIYRAFSIPAKAMMRALTISAPTSTTTAADVGLYRTTKNGSAVVTASFFTAALDLHTTALARSNVVNGNVITLSLMETKLGGQVGPITVGDNEYDVCLTLTAAAGATTVIYVDGSWTEG